MKKIILLSLITASLFAKIERIQEVQQAPTENEQTNQGGGLLSPQTKKSSSTQENTSSKSSATVVQKLDPVSNPNVKYDKSLEAYSIIDHDKRFFKSFVEAKNLPNRTIAGMYHNVADTESLILTAYAYDYAYERPDFADAYYQKFLDKKDLSFEYKLHYIDFLFRTGRLDEIENNLKKVDCIVNFKMSSTCFYYLGVTDYIKTGNNKNSYLRICKDSQPKALDIWNNKFKN
jgi:hypothetical protein